MAKRDNDSNDPKSTMLGLVKVMEWALCLAFGVLAALMGSVKEFGEDHSLRFNLWTVLAPAIVLVLNRLFWRHVSRKVDKEDFTATNPDDSSKPRDHQPPR